MTSLSDSALQVYVKCIACSCFDNGIKPWQRNMA